MRRNPSPQPHCPARTRPIGAMEQYRRARVIWLPNSGILPADLLLPPAVGWLTLLLWLQWAIEIQDFDREDYIMAGKKTIPRGRS